MSGTVGECPEVSRSVWKGPEVGSFFCLPRHCVVVVGGLSWGCQLLIRTRAGNVLRQSNNLTFGQYQCYGSSRHTITWENIGEKYLESGSPSQEGQGT